MGYVSSPGHTQHSKQHLRESSASHKKWEPEKVYTVNHIDYILVEAIGHQLVFKVCISAKLVNVQAISHVGHELGPQLDSVGWGPDGPAEDQSLKPFRLSVHLHHHHSLTLQVHCKEELSRCVIINKDYIITDCTGQNVRNQTEDGERILLEQEDCAASAS